MNLVKKIVILTLNQISVFIVFITIDVNTSMTNPNHEPKSRLTLLSN